ncbi:hypothetical protein [Rubinisphaera margarita]|uniref:hypothetical protein n=1 Tax=Rubinisphaera margarita TaxID=2909586 RepID=UPI001EE8F8FA|nr:hypothetical protein [Rubinisphaera margarita]MCG6158148.1 hypothetical protein [Rubinisphaera margarita]
MTSSLRHPIDIGLVIAGPVEHVDRRAIDNVVATLQRHLVNSLPNFDWKIEILHREEWRVSHVAEPTELLLMSQSERDERGWDMVLVVTLAELESHFKPFCYAAIANSLDAVVCSTARLDPRASEPTANDDSRIQQLGSRLHIVVLHALGHWCRLDHVEDPANIMFDFQALADVDQATTFEQSQLDQMTDFLADIADQRLEERAGATQTWTPLFYLQATWENRGEIIDAVWRARPWQFPYRLSRLTTAAVSTMLVLLMTAETWDMATKQPASIAVGLMVSTLILTTGYVAGRQQLFLRRGRRRLTEQIVTSNVAAAAIVGVGMSIMFSLLFILTLLACWILFPAEVVNGWTASVDSPLQIGHYLRMATIVGSLGIVIGALGASFEEQHHFRHVVLVDEEV